MKNNLIKLASFIFIGSTLLYGCSGDSKKEFAVNNYNCSYEGFKLYEAELTKNMGNDKNAAQEVLAKLQLFKKQCVNNKLGQFNPQLKKIEGQSIKCAFLGTAKEMRECEAPFEKQIQELMEQWKKEK